MRRPVVDARCLLRAMVAGTWLQERCLVRLPPSLSSRPLLSLKRSGCLHPIMPPSPISPAPGLQHRMEPSLLEAARMRGEDAKERGGLCSALRLVDPGEDPRILSTHPDHFFRKPWANVSALTFVTLGAASMLAVRFLTIALWDSSLPW